MILLHDIVQSLNVLAIVGQLLSTKNAICTRLETLPTYPSGHWEIYSHICWAALSPQAQTYPHHRQGGSWVPPLQQASSTSDQTDSWAYVEISNQDCHFVWCPRCNVRWEVNHRPPRRPPSQVAHRLPSLLCLSDLNPRQTGSLYMHSWHMFASWCWRLSLAAASLQYCRVSLWCSPNGMSSRGHRHQQNAQGVEIAAFPCPTNGNPGIPRSRWS